LLLGFLLTTQAIGLFNVAIQIPQLFITLAQIFSNALILPLASKAYREVSVNGIIFDQVPSWRKLKHRFEMLVLAVLLLMAFIIPFSLTFSDSFITFLYGAEYEAAGAIFTILFASTLIGLLGIGYRSLLPAFDRQGAYFKITLIQSAFVLITGWFAIKYFGVVGGAYSILIGELFALFSVIFYLRAIGLAFSLRYDLASLGFHLVSSRNYPIKKSRVEK
jgi:O-antigen/teichoic acid export membrane protein